MAKAIRFREVGGPEVLTLETVDLPDLGPGDVLLRQTAVGVNYIDTYQRSGLYALPLPSGLGLEAAGVVEAVGPGVSLVAVGQRVCYGTGPLGAYADRRVMPENTLLAIPDTITDTQAAGMMLRGMTVRYLIRQTFPVQSGMTVLLHAAAGGVGLIACQWLKHLGVTTIGTVGSDEKAALARAHGCSHVINYSTENFVERVREITGGQGVPVVYDGVGAAVFEGSLDCLQRRGMMVTFGNASGPVPPIAPALLSQKGSLFLTRPTLAHYTADRRELVDTANDLFAVVGNGAVKIDIGQTYALADAVKAHQDLAGRRTTGSTVLIP
ncbi:quinone oxidoreductase family protein [Rhodospirillum rubrum]|uniref:Zinc-containing alcohol dehydrogenase superfamily n=1 Tax=Rhodospirillum rubrum (strain ATCC 11170 / ATH 1.1.1 / DSM 467 / LMG 4362 / NCIMB 8255 / S1) TaxID=269796 RepID=Q2RN81_RHORT|nr:quinone oxidoreductase [Rhodospirillum rubrum]ABC24414.1 Zinc-containing alcohol dehydrogenase superfamily [Rhodospirillum rubrum ATCC 11170]AEO50165.1 zinc-containing alcohol dehydrogenase superfamily protein [Rhodospirillum rubrum F11]MBK5956134.1 quinone oxidoreductase [Rhodospirillum rubrum]QXG80337.1 quinone oxidoreductase [Rhodospirillum rubrum]HAQ00084.1 quinone oxidoreductase [Rhodospirillum rubrum]